MDDLATRKRIWLTAKQKQAICISLIKECKENGKPKRGTFADICKKFGIGRNTVSRMWMKANSEINDTGSMSLERDMARKVGKKKVPLDLVKVAMIPLHQRTTIRGVADKLKVSKSHVQRQTKKGVIRRHSNAIKPALKEVHKIERVRFSLSMIDITSEPEFRDFHEYVHVDEKWYYISKEAQNYYLTPEELDPERSCQNKRFITKVMFLTAVARPRTDAVTGMEFDGKIGLWPFVYEEAAKRASKNRPAGTMVTKSMNAVTKPIYRSFLVEKVLPAIIEKWPQSSRDRTILIQQDNAKPHISVTDAEFEDAAKQLGINVKIVCQPPNSPDMNVLDLGFFRSIEALQQKARLRNINELLDEVVKAFYELPTSSLSNVFLTLQECMIEVLKVKGSNNYKIPHMHKAGLQRLGLLPKQLQVEPELVRSALAFLEESRDDGTYHNNTPLPDILANPCVEFAIETLIGGISVGFDLETEEGTS